MKKSSKREKKILKNQRNQNSEFSKNPKKTQNSAQKQPIPRVKSLLQIKQTVATLKRHCCDQCKSGLKSTIVFDGTSFFFHFQLPISPNNNPNNFRSLSLFLELNSV